MENEEVLMPDVEDEDALTISPEELEMLDAQEESVSAEAVEPYENIGTFKIDENMPEELKQQLAKFNRQTESLNNIMNNGVPADAEYAISDDEEDDDFEESESESIDDIPEDGADVGDLF